MAGEQHIGIPAADDLSRVEAGLFEQEARRFEAREITPDDFARFRLMRGVYGIRGAPDHHMVRCKIPGGLLTAGQMERLGDIAEHYTDHSRLGGGLGHITTRQNVQFHWVHRRDVPAVLRLLGEVGLTTREACGNTVRNVTACHLAGICKDEAFDVWAYAKAVQVFFLRNPISQNLPRKFKIAFSGCATDCAFAAIHDIGIIAAPREVDGARRRGFRILIGGGLGAVPRAAVPLEDWTPADELIVTCEAVVRVFDRHGNRKNKNAARLKFVVEKLGPDAVRELVLAERATLLRLDPSKKHDPVDGARSAAALPPQPREFNVPEPSHLDYHVWRGSNVVAQRQEGWHAVFVALPAGDLTPGQFRGLAALARDCGNGTLSTSYTQNIVLRWVPEGALPQVWERLRDLGLARPGALWVTNVVGCPGAQTCNIALTHSHRLAYQVLDRLLARPELVLDPALENVKIKISGCPNACGHHHIADIGLFGSARHVGGRFVPSYQVLLGGYAGGGVAEFGKPFMRVPAKAAPDMIVRLLETYLAERRPGESFRDWVRRLRDADQAEARSGEGSSG